MSVINEIVDFAAAGAVANGDVLDVAAYAADPDTARGHQLGIARRELENTALRQLSRFCRGVAEFIAERHAAGVVDDGDAAKIVAGLEDGIGQMIAAHDANATAHPDIRALIAVLAGARVESMWLGAGAMLPSKSAGATAGTAQGAAYLLTEDYLDYSATVDQSAELALQLPANWDRAAVKVKLHWRPAASGATAGQYVGWTVSGGAVGDGDAVDRALGAAVTVADQALAGLEAVEHVTPSSAAVTIGGDPQPGDRLHLRIARDADYAGDGAALPVAARLLGVEVQYGVSGQAAAWS